MQRTLSSSSIPGAPLVHIDVPSPREAAFIVRAIARVLADSNRTLDIVAAEELVSGAQLRFLLERGALATDEGRALLRDRPQLRETNMDALRALPDGTLGREFVRYLDRFAFDYDVDSAVSPHVRDPDAQYLMQRIRKNHDIWHVLLGLGPAGHEEVLVHAFTLTNVGIPSSVAIVILGAIKHMVLERRWGTLRHALRDAYELGRRCRPLITVRWEDLWAEPIDDVRRRFGLHVVDVDGHAYGPS